MSRRTSVLVALTGVLVTALTLGTEQPASSAVTQTAITSPVDGSSYLVDAAHPATNVNVLGTSDGTSGDFLQIRCYYNAHRWTTIGGTAVEPDGDFAASMGTAAPYGTCVLRAVPTDLPAGADLSAFTGPRVTSEQDITDRVDSGPNQGKVVDYYVIDQGSLAMNDYGSASGQAILDTRLQYPNGHSGGYLWNGAGGWGHHIAGEGRAPLQVDGHNAYLPYSASGMFNEADQVEGLPALSYDVTRGATSTVIHETDPAVRCTTDTFPATAESCTAFLSAGVRLERTITTTDGGRQTRIRDLWRSTDGQTHTVSVRYRMSLSGYSTASTPTSVAIKLPWLSSAYEPFVEPTSVPGPSTVPQSVFVRSHLTAADGDADLPRGAVTFDTRPVTVVRTLAQLFMLRDRTVTVPAGGTALVRHNYVIGATEAEVEAKAATSRAQLHPFRPDGLIRLESGATVGNNVYNSTGTDQARTARRRRGTRATFHVTVQNDGTATDSFRLAGSGNKRGFRVTYLRGRTTITAGVTGGTYVLRNLEPGQARTIRLVVRVRASAKPRLLRSWLVTAASVDGGLRSDTVKAAVRVRAR